MTDITLWLLLFFFLTILLTGAPIGAALGLSSAIVIFATMNVPLVVVAQRMFTSIDSFSFMAVPFFMLAGSLCPRRVTRRLVDFANALVGALPADLPSS
jgi:C4-dicarboxylate transporter DctM subunit